MLDRLFGGWRAGIGGLFTSFDWRGEVSDEIGGGVLRLGPHGGAALGHGTRRVTPLDPPLVKGDGRSNSLKLTVTLASVGIRVCLGGSCGIE